MDKEQYIIIGLGNPGSKYQHTRHNVGFDVIEVISQKLSIPVKRSRCQGLVGEGSYKGTRIILCQPQTFMNDSGRCVTQLLQWYKVSANQIIIIYDDIDLPQGKLRIRKNGSAGTHNGMRSIIQYIGTQDFPRIRVGVGAKPEGWDLADWVLSHYKNADERETAFQAFKQAADCALEIVDSGIDQAMQQFNQKNTGKDEKLQ